MPFTGQNTCCLIYLLLSFAVDIRLGISHLWDSRPCQRIWKVLGLCHAVSSYPNRLRFSLESHPTYRQCPGCSCHSYRLSCQYSHVAPTQRLRKTRAWLLPLWHPVRFHRLFWTCTCSHLNRLMSRLWFCVHLVCLIRVCRSPSPSVLCARWTLRQTSRTVATDFSTESKK